MNPQPHTNSHGPVRSLLRIPEVAERLRIGRTTVYALLHQGAPLRVVHIGRAARIEASSVDEYIEQLAHIPPEDDQDDPMQRSA